MFRKYFFLHTYYNPENMPETGYAEDRTLQSLLNDLRASNLIVQQDHTILAFGQYSLVNNDRLILVIDQTLEITATGWNLKSPYTGSEMVSDLIVLFSSPTIYLNSSAYVAPTGELHLGGKPLYDLGEPTEPQHAATKAFVDAAVTTLQEAADTEAETRATADTALQTSLDALTADFTGLFKVAEAFTLDLASTIGDVDYYEPNQIVLLVTEDTNSSTDPDTTRFLGWKVEGTGIPEGTTISSYRHDYTNPSSTGRAIFATLSADVPPPLGPHTISTLAKLKQDANLKGHSLKNVADGSAPQDVAAFHQIGDAVDQVVSTIETSIGDAVATEASARETADASLQEQLDTTNSYVAALFQKFFQISPTSTLA